MEYQGERLRRRQPGHTSNADWQPPEPADTEGLWRRSTSAICHGRLRSKPDVTQVFYILTFPVKRKCGDECESRVNTVPGTKGWKWVPFHLTAFCSTEYLHAKQEQGQLVGTEGLAADSSQPWTWNILFCTDTHSLCSCFSGRDGEKKETLI